MREYRESRCLMWLNHYFKLTIRESSTVAAYVSWFLACLARVCLHVIIRGLRTRAFDVILCCTTLPRLRNINEPVFF